MDEDQRAGECRTTDQLQSKPVVRSQTFKQMKDTCDDMRNGFLSCHFLSVKVNVSDHSHFQKTKQNNMNKEVCIQKKLHRRQRRQTNTLENKTFTCMVGTLKAVLMWSDREDSGYITGIMRVAQ